MCCVFILLTTLKNFTPRYYKKLIFVVNQMHLFSISSESCFYNNIMLWNITKLINSFKTNRIYIRHALLVLLLRIVSFFHFQQVLALHHVRPVLPHPLNVQVAADRVPPDASPSRLQVPARYLKVDIVQGFYRTMQFYWISKVKL